MSNYLAPGVYVEETSFRSKSIDGVSTSVAALAGPTRFGPIRGMPEVITSYNEYERIYGSTGRLNFNDEVHLNHTALAARAFFDNGGKQLFVTRVVRGGNDTDDNGFGSSAQTAAVASANAEVAFAARFPGSGGNLDLEISWDDAQNLLKTTALKDPDMIPNAQTGLIKITGLFTGGVFSNAAAADNFQSLTVLVTRDEANLDLVAGTEAIVDSDSYPGGVAIPVADIGDSLIISELADLNVSYKKIVASRPASGPLSDGTPAELLLAEPVYFTGTSGNPLGDAKVIRGTLSAEGDEFTVLANRNPEIGSNFTFNLSALAAIPGAAQSLKVQRDFSIVVIRRKVTATNPSGDPGQGEPIYQISGLSLDSNDSNFLGAGLPQNPEKRLDWLTVPITCSADDSATPAQIYGALLELAAEHENLLIPPVDSFNEPRYIISLTDGSDGDLPMAIDYAGETDEVKGSTGLASLEEIEDISIVLTPFAAADQNNHQAVVSELWKHCVRMRYRIGLVDSRANMAISEVREFRDNFDDSRLALYYPWIVTSDPTGLSQTVAVPPSGFMAGIYARTDVDRGVHKSPANIPVFGALRFNQEINKFQQELLNPQGINCLRSFPGRGHRVWGGRTLSSDPEWRYVNVRRYFLFLERSIEKGSQWAVFEPNGEELWENISNTISSFLFNEWKSGRLLGGEPASAFFVRCDRTTMTQNDIDNGRLICEVGVAPLRPAEFVIFRIGQKTADA